MNVAFTRRQIPTTSDFQRILALPKRVMGPADSEAIAKRLDSILKLPDNPCGDAPVVNGLCSRCGAPVNLRALQGWGLYELGMFGGAFVPARVSAGKTLLSLLAPFVVQAKRPLLVVPASLKDKTEIARVTLGKHWRVAKHMRVMSYEELGRESKAREIEFYYPDLFIFDEVHRLKNQKAGVTRRVKRYMAKDPRTKLPWTAEARPKVMAMSGTMLGGGSIKTFSHFLRWCFGDGAPVPLEDGELDEWAACLDEAANFLRPHPGPLVKLASAEDVAECDGDELRIARKGFQRRLLETPGVVSTSGEQVACSLYIRGHLYTPNATTDENFQILRDKMETPDGWPLTMAAESWRVARELALGFHGVWDPRPHGFVSTDNPGPWLVARKAWSAFVRDILSRSRTLDTEHQVALACAKGQLPRDEYDAWTAIKDSFRIKPKDIWHDTAALEACEAWMKKGPGIVWVEHIFFGDELERRTGAPYFREGGSDKSGRNLEVLSELIKAGKATVGPIIASVHACQAGFNLQPWARNLLTSCPSGAKACEQLIGRTHRDGQKADQVEVDILLGCIEHFESWENALAQARMAIDVMGADQKILITDPIMPHMPREGARWTKPSGGTTSSRETAAGPWWERGLAEGERE